MIGGHSEVTPELNRPVVVGCAMGVTEPGRYVTSGGSRPGDKLILTKSAGLEGTAILATDKYGQLEGKIDRNLLKSAMRFYDQISVVEEAVLAFNVGGVTAMHDPTEGGVAGGIHELADASGVGVRIVESSIPVAPQTSEICEVLELDPLQLIGSGALLISARPGYSEKIIDELTENNIKASVVGELLEDPKTRSLVHADGTVTGLVRPVCDHLWVALKR